MQFLFYTNSEESAVPAQAFDESCDNEWRMCMNDKRMLIKIAGILRESDMITPEEEAAMLEMIRLEA